MIREGRELLAELASVNTDVVPLAMHLMEQSATGGEQHKFAERLIVLGQQLHHRADETQRVVIEGAVLLGQSVALPLDDGAGTGNHQNLVGSPGGPVGLPLVGGGVRG